MSGKPFDDKAKARLAKHILSGGRVSADEEPEQKVPTVQHAANTAAAFGDTNTQSVVGKIGPSSPSMNKLKDRIGRMGAGRKI